MADELVTLSREHIYALVWKRPIRQVAKHHGLKPRDLARICEKLKIPVPPLGYWSSIRGGATPLRPPLPPAAPGTPTSHTFTLADPPPDVASEPRETMPTRDLREPLDPTPPRPPNPSADYVRLNREHIYARIWKHPLDVVARFYGLSAETLARLCERLTIPVPEAGYWAALAAGEVRPRPPLPPTAPEVPSSHVFRLPDRAAKWSLVVAPILDAPHPLVAQSVETLKGAKPRQLRGLFALRNCLDIRVSASYQDRALRVMDALLKRFTENGHTVEVAHVRGHWSVEGPRYCASVTRVLVQGESVEFGIDERFIEEPAVGPAQPKRTPTGELSLVIRNVAPGSGFTWSDQDGRPIEACLHEFVFGLEKVRTAARHERRKREQIKLRLVEERREKARERARESMLIEFVNDAEFRTTYWTTARSLREMVEVVESRLPAMPEKRRARFADWLAFARSWVSHLEKEALKGLPRVHPAGNDDDDEPHMRLYRW